MTVDVWNKKRKTPFGKTPYGRIGVALARFAVAAVAVTGVVAPLLGSVIEKKNAYNIAELASQMCIDKLQKGDKIYLKDGILVRSCDITVWSIGSQKYAAAVKLVGLQPAGSLSLPDMPSNLAPDNYIWIPYGSPATFELEIFVRRKFSVNSEAFSQKLSLDVQNRIFFGGRVWNWGKWLDEVKAGFGAGNEDKVSEAMAAWASFFGASAETRLSSVIQPPKEQPRQVQTRPPQTFPTRGGPK